MMRCVRGLRTGTLAVAAIGLLALLPAWAAAETLVIKNELAVPVIVQASCVVRGKVIRDRPVLLQPGDTANVMLPGNKLITVSKPRAGRPLYTGIIPAATEDQYQSIQLDSRGDVRTEPTKSPP